VDYSFERCKIGKTAQPRRDVAWLFLLSLLASAGSASALEGGPTSAEPFKLHATVSELGRTGIADSIWRYFSDLGAAAYVKGDYASAERYYQAALLDAEKHKVDDRNLVLMLTNLAASLREQGKYDQSGVLFKSALSKSEKLGTGKAAPYAYTLRQYATLLRKTGREEEARFAYESAQSGSRLVRQSAVVSSTRAARTPLLSASEPAQNSIDRPGQPVEESSRSDSGAAPESTGAQYEDTIIFDFTVIGVSQFPGADPDARIFHHSRTELKGARGDWVRNALGQMSAP
jgi:tetratricopeptide (TPR) repeat protein